MMKMEILCAFGPQQILLHFLSFFVHRYIIKCFLPCYFCCPSYMLSGAFLSHLPCTSVSSVPTCRFFTYMDAYYQRLMELFPSFDALKHQVDTHCDKETLQRMLFNGSMKPRKLCTVKRCHGRLHHDRWLFPLVSFPLDHLGSQFYYLYPSQHTGEHSPFLSSLSPLRSITLHSSFLKGCQRYHFYIFKKTFFSNPFFSWVLPSLSQDRRQFTEPQQRLYLCLHLPASAAVGRSGLHVLALVYH